MVNVDVVKIYYALKGISLPEVGAYVEQLKELKTNIFYSLQVIGPYDCKNNKSGKTHLF